MAKTRSQKLATVQKSMLNKNNVKIRITEAFCSIQLGRKDFSYDGESKINGKCHHHQYSFIFVCFLSFVGIIKRCAWIARNELHPTTQIKGFQTTKSVFTEIAIK